ACPVHGLQTPGVPARLRPGRLPGRRPPVVLRADPAGIDGPAGLGGAPAGRHRAYGRAVSRRHRPRRAGRPGAEGGRGGTPMSDACGCGGELRPTGQDGAEEREPERLWQVRELRFAAAAGVCLLAGALTAWAGTPPPVPLTLNALALALGAWTFVPGTLRRLV